MIYKNKRELIDREIASDDVVLDVGFHGQGITRDSEHWPHTLIQKRAKEVYGIDLELPDSFKANARYQVASAENFSFPVKFDVIFAGDLIEHLSNPGLFIDNCRKHLAPQGRLVLTTPNAFNLFNIAEKFTKREPTVNSDHTFYFNSKTLKKLLEKNGMEVTSINFLYSLEYDFKESWKKKLLNIAYAFLAKTTDKFIETLVITAVAK